MVNAQLEGFEALDPIRMKVSELHEDEDNVNLHSEQDLEATRRSLNSFSQVETLVVDADTGKVIGGNGRLRLIKEAGWEDVMVWPVRGTPQQLTTLAITLNKTPRNSEFDFGKLITTLRELEQFDPELLALTGFPEHELIPLLDSDMAVPLDFDEDEFDTDEPSTPGSDLEKRGMTVQFSVAQKPTVDGALAHFRGFSSEAGQTPADILTVICSEYVRQLEID